MYHKVTHTITQLLLLTYFTNLLACPSYLRKDGKFN